MKNGGGLDGESARFVLLRHEIEPSSKQALQGEACSHWDLMFELDDSLLTFRLETLPNQNISASSETRHRILRLADHRLRYLEYEGPLSQNRGTVSQVSAGEYHKSAEQSDADRYHLRASNLTADLIIPHCPIGEYTHLECLAWQLRK